MIGPLRAVSAVFLCLDCVILLNYARERRFYGGSCAYYGQRLLWHVGGSLLCLASGAMAIFFHPWPSLAVIHGTSAVLFCAPSAILLARYTAGRHGMMLSGYAIAGLLWGLFGLRVALKPSDLQRLFQLYIFSHTFAIVRATFWVYAMAGLPTEENDLAYTVNTFSALLSTLIMAGGRRGAALWAVLLALSLWGEALGLGRRLHVLRGGGSRQMRPIHA